MADIRPFHGIRYASEHTLSSVVAPPYDVISPAQRRELSARDQHNVVRLILPTDDGPADGLDWQSGAAASLAQWQSDGVLARDESPALYVYRETFRLADGSQHTRLGFLCALRIEPFESHVVLPHERTHAGPMDARLELLRRCRANLSPVFALYRDESAAIKLVLSSVAATPPHTSLVDADGFFHELWCVVDTMFQDDLRSLLDAEPVYIADGHHRYGAAMRYRDEAAAANPAHTGDEPYNYVLTYLCASDDPGLVVFPTHRLVRGLAWDVAGELADRARPLFDIIPVGGKSGDGVGATLAAMERLAANSQHAFGAYVGGRYMLLTPSESARAEDLGLAERPAVYRALDVAVLHYGLLERALGVDGGGLSRQETNLGFTQDAAEAVKRVDSGEYQLALFLNATPVSQVLRVAEAGEVMPQKSTFFYPKLLTGLVINPLG